MHHSRRAYAPVLLGMALLGASGSQAALAQDEPAPEVDLGPPPRPITVWMVDRPTVSVSLSGDHGPVRITGTLEHAPAEILRLTDIAGRPREAGWNDVQSISRTDFPEEGFPVGSYRAYLGETAPVHGSNQGFGYGPSSGGNREGEWRALRLPEGRMTLRGEPYGTLTFPLSRLVSYQVAPVQGNIGELPMGTVRLEILEGSAVSLPLRDVQSLHRDLRRGTISVTLVDFQTFTGKLVELPKVTLQLGDERTGQRIPMERVASLHRAVPGGALVGGLGGGGGQGGGRRF